MKKINKTIFSFVFVFSLSSIIFCDVTSSITSLVGRNAEGYLAPIGTMMGSGMNSGFYRKASPHKILGFDITLDLVYAMAPAGQTTYNFVIPDDSIGYSFPFEFPKTYLYDLVPDNIKNNVLGNIPDANTEDNPQYNNNGLYQDFEIGFNLPLQKLLNEPQTPAQNILGNSTTTDLEFDFSVAGEELFSQIVDGTWAVAKEIDGIGQNYVVYDVNDLDLDGDTNEIIYEIEARFDSTSFRDTFAENEGINSTLKSTLESMNIALPIPGGFSEEFQKLPIDIGLPLPILQASVGLPFHTEITARGLPVAMPIGIGTVKYGGFGAKIGISEYLSDILYKSENEMRRSKSEYLEYIIDSKPSDINPKNVSKAISYLRLQEMNIHELDSLNYLFGQGEPTVVIEIQNRMRDAQIQLESMPKSKKKKKKEKKFPIDLALGYYTNDLELDFSGATINSTNRMISLQAGKTLNLPSFLAFLGGVGIYGGVGFESSDLNLGYTLNNPLDYGCFTGSGDTKQYQEGIEEDACTGTNKNWTFGVPLDISLSFPGDNTFRSLIGARVRILLVDAYVDYNMGNSNNSINAGIGITFR